jgi:hypothetical protein
VLKVSSDQPLDAMCIGLDAAGAHRFGQRYDLIAQPLPQTLSVLSGGRSSFQETVLGYRRGMVDARVRQEVPFKSGAVLQEQVPLDGCVPRTGSSATFSGAASIPGSFDRATLLSSPAGELVLAIGTASTVVKAVDLTNAPIGAPPAVPTTDLAAADLDGDCQLDVVALPGPSLLTRAADGSLVAQPGALPADGRSAAVGDVDADGNPDLVMVGGGQAHVLLGDGAGHFHELAAAFDQPPTDATAVVLGDLDGDGNLDVVIGQGSATPAPTRVYLNDRGSGHFLYSPGSLPPLPLRATALALADVDLDGDLDLVAAHADSSVRLYVNRGDAYFEDRSFAGLPDQVAALVPTLLFADLNGDCLPDLVVPRAGGAPLLWLHAGSDLFKSGPALPAPESLGVLADDVSGDGLTDLVAYGANGLTLLEQK